MFWSTQKTNTQYFVFIVTVSGVEKCNKRPLYKNCILNHLLCGYEFEDLFIVSTSKNCEHVEDIKNSVGNLLNFALLHWTKVI
jgi:hypothetical protein